MRAPSSTSHLGQSFALAGVLALTSLMVIVFMSIATGAF